MARSARATVIKRNSSVLRHKVFGPADDARTARLSAKLMELAQQPKPDKLIEEMEIEDPKAEKTPGTNTHENAMDIDADPATAAKSSSKKSNSKKSSRVQKKRRGKATSTITFPKMRKSRSSSGSKKSKK